MTIIAPLAFPLIIITVVRRFVKPDVAKEASYIAIIAVVLLALIKGGGAQPRITGTRAAVAS